MARQYAAVTAMGHDRVGAADDLASWIAQSQGNVEESKMAVLGGEFAVLMLVSGEDSCIHTLIDGAAPLGDSLGLHIEVTETHAPHGNDQGRPYAVESFSLDSPGIVHSLTREIRGLGISIEELETSRTSAPMTGAPIFRMRALVILPATVSLADFRNSMDELAHLKDLDIRIEPL
ncbi:MAG: amino acid-binding protein [Spirochaetales bacterium]|nr:amino acid-binding protein [Spirochaetales bacterium]